MRSTKVLLIESARKNGVTFAASLKRKYEVLVASSGQQGLELAGAEKPDVVILNAESMRTSGDRIAARLRAQFGDLPIIHIRPEETSTTESSADVVLTPPFTSRKLINRVQRYVKTPESEMLSVGPFNLNLAQQTLTTPWGEKKLTPKLAELMALFLQNQDNTLERKHIMQTIWKTDYMGDTRTLDVHIRWLRKVVEPEPRKPKYITTVRGVGYCFKLPEGSASEQKDKSEAKNKQEQHNTEDKTSEDGNSKTELQPAETVRAKIAAKAPSVDDADRSRSVAAVKAPDAADSRPTKHTATKTPKNENGGS